MFNNPQIAMISIRPMKESDVPPVADIERQSFPNPWTEQSFLYEINSKTKLSRFFVAETDGGEIAGYAGLWFFPGEGHIANIAVKINFRSLGIGKTLLKYLIGFAREQGVETLFLEVASQNLPARRLYNSLGFHEQGIRRKYYPGDDAILMVCKL